MYNGTVPSFLASTAPCSMHTDDGIKDEGGVSIRGDIATAHKGSSVQKPVGDFVRLQVLPEKVGSAIVVSIHPADKLPIGIVGLERSPEKEPAALNGEAGLRGIWIHQPVRGLPRLAIPPENIWNAITVQIHRAFDVPVQIGNVGGIGISEESPLFTVKPF